jgi:hypothetical protein
MSDEDQSSDSKSFLTRWSQRKLEAKQPERETPSVEVNVASGAVSEKAAVEEFDLSSLPKLEELTATTDITMFLHKCVPESLRNAALRKFWALDPAIRNYVSPALEYAYDWNTPGGVPGSTELGPGVDVARLVSQIMGTDKAPVQEPISPPDGPVEQASAQTLQYDAVQGPEPDDAVQGSDLGQPNIATRLSEVISIARTASNPGEHDREPEQRAGSDHVDSAAPQPAVRRHGSARPFD